MGKLGDTLRERRQFLGLTIEQAEVGTKIRARLLEALESGDYDRLPNPGYVRGYVSSYARYLDLEPGPLLSMYRAETGAASQTRDLNLPAIEEAVAPRHQQHAVPWRAAVSIALVLALVSLAIWAVTRFVDGQEETPPVPAPVTGTTTTPTPDQGSGTTSPAQTQETPPSGEQAKPQDPEAATVVPFTLKVTVAQDGASWLRVTIDGKQAYEGSLAGGQSKTFEVANEATLRIGKPEVVSVTRDGKKVTIPKSGDIPTLTLKAKPAE